MVTGCKPYAFNHLKWHYNWKCCHHGGPGLSRRPFRWFTLGLHQLWSTHWFCTVIILIIVRSSVNINLTWQHTNMAIVFWHPCWRAESLCLLVCFNDWNQNMLDETTHCVAFLNKTGYVDNLIRLFIWWSAVPCLSSLLFQWWKSVSDGWDYSLLAVPWDYSYCGLYHACLLFCFNVGSQYLLDETTHCFQCCETIHIVVCGRLVFSVCFNDGSQYLFDETILCITFCTRWWQVVLAVPLPVGLVYCKQTKYKV